MLSSKRIQIFPLDRYYKNINTQLYFVFHCLKFHDTLFSLLLFKYLHNTLNSASRLATSKIFITQLVTEKVFWPLSYTLISALLGWRKCVAHRGYAMCPLLHSWSVVTPGFKPRQPGAQSVLLKAHCLLYCSTQLRPPRTSYPNEWLTCL